MLRKPQFDPNALTRERASALLRSLRAACDTLRNDLKDTGTGYDVWEALELLGKWDEAVAALKAALRSGGYSARPVGPRIALDDVALVAVDCSNPDLAAAAMQASLARCRFGEAILFTDSPLQSPGVRIAKVDSITSLAAYSRFIMKTLGSLVDAAHVLVVQWDGFVLDGSRWSDEFLLYDYVGARWPQYEGSHVVGNGGFSLRSSKLLRALQDPDLAVRHPEDDAICRVYRDYLERRYGIAFAPEEVADAFSFELDVRDTATFGFHGMCNLWRVIDSAEIRSFGFLQPHLERWSDELAV